MRTLKAFVIIAAAAFLAACSGGSDNTLVGANTGVGVGGANIASVTVLTSNPQLQSDGASAATITALVRDTNNNVVPDVPVLFARHLPEASYSASRLRPITPVS